MCRHQPAQEDIGGVVAVEHNPLPQQIEQSDDVIVALTPVDACEQQAHVGAAATDEEQIAEQVPREGVAGMEEECPPVSMLTHNQLHSALDVLVDQICLAEGLVDEVSTMSDVIVHGDIPPSTTARDAAEVVVA
ncbi:hypothetical protein ABZP36_008429 [Zizania latifolia]